MSGLRDARLKRALESAPDADARPDPRVRRAVLDAARQAVEPPHASWWQRVWQGLGDRTMPWNASLATVALATLVTVLWHDKETPDARPEMPAPVAPAPVIAVPPATSMTQEPPPVSPAAPPARPSPSPSPLAERPVARKAAPVAKPQQPQQQPPEAAASPSPSLPAEAARERRAEAAQGALRDQSRGELAKSGPAPQAADAAGQAESAAAGARAPATAPSPASPAFSRAPSGLASQLARPVTGWTQARIESQGRSVELARGQAPRLVELVDAIARAPSNQQPLQAPVSARVEFRRGAEPAGTLELASGQVRWRGAGRIDSATIEVDAALVQAAQDEIGALMPR